VHAGQQQRDSLVADGAAAMKRAGVASGQQSGQVGAAQQEAAGAGCQGGGGGSGGVQGQLQLPRSCHAQAGSEDRGGACHQAAAAHRRQQQRGAATLLPKEEGRPQQRQASRQAPPALSAGSLPAAGQPREGRGGGAGPPHRRRLGRGAQQAQREVGAPRAQRAGQHRGRRHQGRLQLLPQPGRQLLGRQAVHLQYKKVWGRGRSDGEAL
jgi:hypothetical protein